MRIESSHRPEPPKPVTPSFLKSGGLAPVPLSRDQRNDPLVTLRELQCFALGLSAFVYQYNLHGLERILTREGFDQFQGFNPGRDPDASGFGGDRSKIGMGFRSDRRAWLVFRGSDDALDWDTNLQISKTSDNIHSGFWNAWIKLKPQVLDWLSELDGEIDEVVVTGHSLGGALAVLAAREISECSRLPIRAVFTFGAPRVGGDAFVGEYDMRESHAGYGAGFATLGGVTWQMRNSSDIVPKVPLRLFGYRHCGQDGRPLWPENMNLEQYLKEQWGALPTCQEPSAMPIVVVAGLDPLREIVKGWIEMFSALMPHIRSLFGALGTAGDSGLSHRMKEYRHYFGCYTSFWQATDRQPEVLEAIQDQRVENDAPTAQVTAFKQGPVPCAFERERTEGWTTRLTVAVAAGLGLLGVFVFLLIMSVQTLREDLRWMGYLFVALSLISFAGWIKRRL